MQKAETLEQLLLKNVAETLRKIKRPFGVFLSGGVDSGLLAAFTRPDVVFTCKFDYGELFDELSYAEETARYLNLRQVIIEPTKKDFFRYLPKAVKIVGKTTHFSLVPLYMLFKKAKEEGIKTILSGEGPDEYLGGYTNHAIILNEQRFYEQEELKNYSYVLDKYFGSVLSRYARISGKTEEEIATYWNRYTFLVSKMGYTDLRTKGIEAMERALAKHFGITLLYPYMTQEIEDFCFNEITDDEKIQGFTTKHIFRRIAQQYIPESVAWRKNKMGGPVAPVSHWLGHPERPFDKTEYLKLQESCLS